MAGVVLARPHGDQCPLPWCCHVLSPGAAPASAVPAVLTRGRTILGMLATAPGNRARFVASGRFVMPSWNCTSVRAGVFPAMCQRASSRASASVMGACRSPGVQGRQAPVPYPRGCLAVASMSFRFGWGRPLIGTAFRQRAPQRYCAPPRTMAGCCRSAYRASAWLGPGPAFRDPTPASPVRQCRPCPASTIAGQGNDCPTRRRRWTIQMACGGESGRFLARPESLRAVDGAGFRGQQSRPGLELPQGVASSTASTAASSTPATTSALPMPRHSTRRRRPARFFLSSRMCPSRVSGASPAGIAVGRP